MMTNCAKLILAKNWFIRFELLNNQDLFTTPNYIWLKLILEPTWYIQFSMDQKLKCQAEALGYDL